MEIAAAGGSSRKLLKLIRYMIGLRNIIIEIINDPDSIMIVNRDRCLYYWMDILWHNLTVQSS